MSRPAERICIVGSGNWGSAIAKIVGSNAAALPQLEDRVNMWVFEEMVDGRPLTEIINQQHENVKYLPGIELPHNVVAVPELAEAAAGATLLVFVLPHQFLPRLLPQLRAAVAPGCVAISLIKGGLAVAGGEPELISDTIRAGLGVSCAVLMGANVAADVAAGQLCEATIGTTDAELGEMLRAVFHTRSFRITVVQDEAGVELAGALKNIVAIAAGFCDGLGMGTNTKSTIMRLGLQDMMRFARSFFAGRGASDETLWESCGIADLITTCFGGRNRKCAEAYARAGGRRSWDEIEAELLNGQKLQGTLTAAEVHEVLVAKGKTHEYPVFERVYAIAYEGMPVESMVEI